MKVTFNSTKTICQTSKWDIQRELNLNLNAQTSNQIHSYNCSIRLTLHNVAFKN